MIHSINELDLGLDILVIDDSSPDGTADAVRKVQGDYSNLFLLVRQEKKGLASAYKDGFTWAADHGYTHVGEMDADFSHNPEYLPKILSLIKKGHHDVLIGSRYVDGGGTKNWGVIRQMISRFGSTYARTFLGIPVMDMTGGFNFWPVSVLCEIEYKTIISEGYVFQIELKYRAFCKNYTFHEFPIIFEDRRAGETKMTPMIVLEAIYKVPYLRYIVQKSLTLQ